MLSYRHLYHAGNHADVLKHLVLQRCLAYLLRKDSPFWTIDTHAGAGRYDLDHGPAFEQGEARDGVERIWLDASRPEALAPYLDHIRALNPHQRLSCYPGSPLLAARELRDTDRLWLHELHPTDHQRLAEEFAGRRNVKVVCQDGFAGLNGLLPPQPRRALVLIDPSYEQPADYRRVVDALNTALKRFPGGMYLLWYPLLAKREVGQLEKDLARLPATKTLRANLNVTAPPVDGIGMYGSAMFVINPPYVLADELRSSLPWLVERLAQDRHAGWRLDSQGS